MFTQKGEPTGGFRELIKGTREWFYENIPKPKA
jgi:hypothetical protein